MQSFVYEASDTTIETDAEMSTVEVQTLHLPFTCALHDLNV